MGKMKVYRVHGEVTTEIELNIVASSMEEALEKAEGDYRNCMCDYMNGTVGFDDCALNDADSLVDISAENNEIEFTSEYSEEVENWDGCTDPGNCPEECEICPFADDCEDFVEENDEDDEDDFDEDDDRRRGENS